MQNIHNIHIPYLLLFKYLLRSVSSASREGYSTMVDFQGAGWDSLIQGFQHSFDQNKRLEMDHQAFSNSCKKLLERKSTNAWHQKYFNRYLEERMNPVGLRIQIIPTIENISQSLRRKWEDNLQSCSAMMMMLLADEYKEQSNTIDTELQRLYEEQSKLIDKNKLKEIEKETKDHLTVFNQKL